MKPETYKKKAEKLYKKQKRRIENLRKRGYILPDLKPLPKRVDKKVYERLEKQYTLENLYNSPNTFYVETNTKGSSKMVSGKRGRELERSKSAKKGAITKSLRKKGKEYTPDLAKWEDVVIDGIKRQIKEMSKGILEVETDLTMVLEKAISREGKADTAKRIQEREQTLQDSIGEIIFYYETYNKISNRLLNEFKEILLGAGLPDSEKYVEKLKFEDNPNDYLEV